MLVDGGRITDVDFTGADPPEGATLVDLGEATLLPGLIDSHTHIVLDASSHPVGHLAGTSDEALLAGCRARARAALAAGITAADSEPAAASQAIERSAVQQWRPSRSDDSTPRRAIRSLVRWVR